METMALSTHAVFLRNIRRRLRELDMTQFEFACAMGWTEGYVSQLLKGRNVPKLDMADKVAPALRTTPQYLLTPCEPDVDEKTFGAGVDVTVVTR